MHRACVLLAAVAVVCAPAQQAMAQHLAAAASSNDGRGFSFFIGLGQQSLRYRETSRLLPVTSDVRTHSPLLATGALYAVNRDWLFALDAEQTFYPSRATETWRSTAPAFNGITLTDPVVQTNRYSLQQSQTQLTVYRRLQDQWFVTGGPLFRSQSFKRFAFAPGPDRALNPSPDQTVEETSAELLLNIGLALESERVAGAASHYGLRLSAGVPTWRRVENTSQPNVTFNSVRGYDLALEGRYSVAAMDSVQVGAWGRWGLSRRSGQQTSGSNGALVELPSSRLDGWSGGVELLWKL